MRAHRAQATWADLARDAREAPATSLVVLSTDRESLSNRRLALSGVAGGDAQPLGIPRPRASARTTL